MFSADTSFHKYIEDEFRDKLEWLMDVADILELFVMYHTILNVFNEQRTDW